MFRWRRALLHALIPFFLVIAGGLALFALIKPVDAAKAGEGVGRFATFALAAGLGGSYLVQTGRRRAALLSGLGLVTVIVAVVGLLVMRPHPSPLRAADRAPLVEAELGGEHRLRHPTLGFSILRPPPGYAASPQVARAMGSIADDPDTVIYAYAEDPPQAGLVVSVLYNDGGSRHDVQSFIDGVQRGLESSARSQLGSSAQVQVIRREVTGDDAHLEAHLHAVVAGVHTQVNAHALHLPGRPPVLVAVTVISSDETTLAEVLTSLRP
jgi:hypothetical protein